MASNGLVFRPGRGPSFILVGLVVIVIILFYSYWGVSSKNNKLLRDVSVLQDRLRVLAARKLTADKKGSALLTQITQLQEDKEQKDKVITSKDDRNAELSESLQKKEVELSKVRQQEVGRMFQNVNSIGEMCTYIIRIRLAHWRRFFYLTKLIFVCTFICIDTFHIRILSTYSRAGFFPFATSIILTVAKQPTFCNRERVAGYVNLYAR